MIQSLIMLLIYAIVIGLLAWLIFYVVDALGVPDPFGRVIKVVAVVIGVLVIIMLLLKITPAMANDHPCDAYAPYYHSTTNSPGSALGDVFFFIFSAPMAVAIVGGPRKNVINPQARQRARVSTAACMPVSLVRHFVGARPPHVEHWRPE